MKIGRGGVALVIALFGLVVALLSGACVGDEPSSDAGAPSDTGTTTVSDGSIHFDDASTADGGACEPKDQQQAFYACQLYINAWCTRWVKCCADSETCASDTSNSSVSSCMQYQTDHGFNCSDVHGFVCPAVTDACTASIPGLTCEKTSQGLAGRTSVCVYLFEQIAAKGDGG